jgi:hypothetical protein
MEPEGKKGKATRIESGAKSALGVELNMAMISAGVRAFKAWDPHKLEVEGMVCEVFFAMLREAV